MPGSLHQARLVVVRFHPLDVPALGFLALRRTGSLSRLPELTRLAEPPLRDETRATDVPAVLRTPTARMNAALWAALAVVLLERRLREPVAAAAAQIVAVRQMVTVSSTYGLPIRVVGFQSFGMPRLNSCTFA